MVYDSEKFRKQAVEFSRDLVPAPGMRAYFVTLTFTFGAGRGTAVGGWSGTICMPKPFTTYQRYTEALHVIHGLRVKDGVVTEEDGMPDSFVVTFFQCVPDHTFVQHYRKAFVRDVQAIVRWVLRKDKTEKKEES